MGWWEDNISHPAQDFGHGVEHFGQDPLGELGRQYQINAEGLEESTGTGPGPGGPTIQPGDALKPMRDKMINDAKLFRKNLPGYEENQYSSVADAGRDKLEETLGTIKHAANQRGMLFSGLRQGAEGGARANMAGLLAQQRAAIHAEAADLAGKKEEAGASVGLAGYGDAIKRSEDAYNLANQAQVERRRALGQIGEGVGYGLGSLRAQPKPPTDTYLTGPAVDNSYTMPQLGSSAANQSTYKTPYRY